MRGCVLAMLAVGSACGRMGLDDLAEASDAAVPTCAVDGDACDDGNICTATSYCSGGACLPDVPADACMVADSQDDHALVQGNAGWYYGFWNESADPDDAYALADFTPFVLYSDQIWRPADYQDTGPTFTWAYLTWWGGHPGQIPDEKLPILRWVSTVSGRADVVVHLDKSDTSGGDGTRAVMFVDGSEVFRGEVAGTDGVGFTAPVPVTLVPGTTIDVMLHFIGDEGRDTSDLRVQIRSR